MKQPPMKTHRTYILRVLLKASLLLLAVTLLFGVVKPIPWLGKISAYNLVFPGRARLPFGEVPDKAYNLSLYQLDAMFAAHQVAAEKAEDEYRIQTIGDSSIWGFLLPPTNS